MILIVGADFEEQDGYFKIRYVPERDFTGTDEFEVNLSDSIEQTNRTFRITVQ